MKLKIHCPAPLKRLIQPLFACLIAFTYLACDPPSKSEDQESKYAFKTVENDPIDVKIYTLKNGLKVYMSVNKDEPRVQANIAVRAGSKNDPADATGLAHYLEHMLFKGNSEFATTDWEAEKVLLQEISDMYELHRNTSDTAEKRKIYERIDSLSQEAAKYTAPNEYDKMISGLGAKGTNAYTSVERTVYINDIPANELEKWMMIEASRFKELVLRLFHTELETVYEEFNRGQDNDYRKVYATLDSMMFRKHPYGTQTTIGKGEHLKNPSMEKIHEYFNTYYAPNNMAICLSGDIDPEKTIALIEKYFGDMEPKDIPEFSYEPEQPITAPRENEVFGPMGEWVNIGFRFDGVKSEDMIYLELINGILSNGQAGLMDLNLLQKQKVLKASAYASINHDYSKFVMSGNPKQGQSLAEVKDLLLEQLEKIKNGEFDDWLIEAVINDLRLQQTKMNEYNWMRAHQMSDAFILNMDWEEYISNFKKMEAITKEQVVKFAREHFKDNYVAVNKRTGKDPSVYKVEKPKITPIDIQRDVSSDFYKKLDSLESGRLEPVFVDYQKAIQTDELKSNIPFGYIKNNTNNLFSLFYLLDMGSNNDKEMELAIQYLPYLGTSKYSGEALKKEFFKLGVEFNVFTSEDRVYVYLNGLDESFEEGLKLFEHLLNDAQPDENALKELVNDKIKEREDNKKNKWRIMYSGLFNYARYGKNSPFTDVLSEAELKALEAEKLVENIRSINRYKHRIFYYGATDPDAIKAILNKEHQVPEKLNEYPQEKKYKELDITENKVYFVDYDMVQTEMMLVSKGESFNTELMPYASLFNQYFGSGLSSIIFQEIREAKALAYSAYASFGTPRNNDESHYIRAYIGTQSDKLPQAVDAMMELMNEMPEAEGQYQDAKESALKQIETDRITKTSIFWNYETAKRRGLDHDIRKDIYHKIKKMEMGELKGFFNNHIKGKKYTFCLIGKKDDVDFNALKELGEVEELTLEEIFGY